MKWQVTAVVLMHGHETPRTIPIAKDYPTFAEALFKAEQLVADGWYRSVERHKQTAWFARVHDVSVREQLEVPNVDR